MGRGVLLDFRSWAESLGLKSDALATTSIPLEQLLKVAESQNVEFRTGDTLLIRSGYLKAFDTLSDDEVQALIKQSHPSAIGVESSNPILRWLWDTGFAAVAGDMPSFEAWPCQSEEYFLHE